MWRCERRVSYGPKNIVLVALCDLPFLPRDFEHSSHSPAHCRHSHCHLASGAIPMIYFAYLLIHIGYSANRRFCWDVVDQLKVIFVSGHLSVYFPVALSVYLSVCLSLSI